MSVKLHCVVFASVIFAAVIFMPVLLWASILSSDSRHVCEVGGKERGGVEGAGTKGERGGRHSGASLNENLAAEERLSLIANPKLAAL